MSVLLLSFSVAAFGLWSWIPLRIQNLLLHILSLCLPHSLKDQLFLLLSIESALRRWPRTSLLAASAALPHVLVA